MAAHTIDYDLLVEVAYAADLDPDKAIYPAYSGRGMYGDTCLGMVGNLNELMTFGIKLAATLGERGEDADWIPGMSQDSMGMDVIWYWRGTTVTGAPDDDE